MNWTFSRDFQKRKIREEKKSKGMRSRVLEGSIESRASGAHTETESANLDWDSSTEQIPRA